MNKECLFCQIVEGVIPADRVYEDDALLAFRDIAPKAPEHILVIPKRHIENLNAIRSPEDVALIGELMAQLPLIAKQVGLNDGFRTILNTGPGGGQEVYHLHAHLLGGGALPGF